MCQACGNNIPRKIPYTHKKTKGSRRNCYNCSPVRYPKHNGHGAERRRRKQYLVEMLGGKCVKCGYDQSVKALSFHHKKPQKKNFDISNNGNLMRSWEEVIEEAKKCELLCLNCHAELHNGK